MLAPPEQLANKRTKNNKKHNLINLTNTFALTDLILNLPPSLIQGFPSLREKFVDVTFKPRI